MYLRLLTFSIIIVIVTLVYSQIIKPLFDGTPLFPFFSERAKVEKQIERAEEELAIQQEKKKLKQLKDKVEKGKTRNEDEKT